MIRIVALASLLATAAGCCIPWPGASQSDAEAAKAKSEAQDAARRRESTEPVPQMPATVKAGPPRAIDAAALRTEITKAADTARIYNFWATWCGPCMKELPMFRSFQITHPDIPIILVNVDTLAGQQSAVPEAIQGNALQSLQHLLLQAEDPNEALLEAVPNWPSSIPVTLVVDRHGRETARFVERLSTQELEEGVLRARAR